MNAITRARDHGSEDAPLRLRENAHGYLLFVHFPGFEPEDLRVEIVGDTLTVRGRRALEASFARWVRLPAHVDVDHVTAEVVADVLQVYIPKLALAVAG